MSGRFSSADVLTARSPRLMHVMNVNDRPVGGAAWRAFKASLAGLGALALCVCPSVSLAG